MGQTLLTERWGVEIPPQRPVGKPYIGRITDVSKTYKYVEYNPFFVSRNNFWVKVPSEFRHEVIGANRVRVVKCADGKFRFHSAWHENQADTISVFG